jgi:hypothetical protein
MLQQKLLVTNGNLFCFGQTGTHLLRGDAQYDARRKTAIPKVRNYFKKLFADDNTCLVIMTLFIHLIRIKLATSCVMGLTPLGYLKLNWTIGIGRVKLQNVCRKRFCMVYGVKKYTLDLLCKSVKQSSLTFDKPFNDRSGAFASNNISRQETGKYIAKLVSLCERNRINLSKEQVSSRTKHIAIIINNKLIKSVLIIPR